MQAAVFLDRDNTLIHGYDDIGDPAEVRLIQGAASAIASLCGLGYKIVVVTNQGGVARGLYTEDDVHAVHQRLQELVKHASNGARVDAFYYCPYHPEGTVEQYRQEHRTRKPQPGMLEQAAKDLKLDLSQSWMIGDRTCDVQAGRAAGCRTVLLRPDAQRIAPDDEVPAVAENGTSQGVLEEGQEAAPDVVARNIIEAVRVIAQQRKPEAVEEIPKAPAGVPGAKRWDAAAVAQLQRHQSDDETPEEGGPQGSLSTEEAEASGPAENSKSPRAPRPFRPVGAPVPKEEADEEPIVARRRREHRPESQRPADPSPAEPTSKPPPMPSTETPADAAPPETAEEPTPTAQGALEEPATPNASPSETPTTRTLRLILQELRHQRGTHHDQFSYPKMIAIVLQTLAGICLLGALWMGSGDSALFWRWMGAGLLVQGATIAALLFDR